MIEIKVKVRIELDPNNEYRKIPVDIKKEAKQMIMIDIKEKIKKIEGIYFTPYCKGLVKIEK